MIRKRVKCFGITAILTLCALLCFACGKGADKTSPRTVTIAAEESYTATYGSVFALPSVVATTENGSQYTPSAIVYDADKLQVKVVDNAFTVADMRGYTVKYTLPLDGIVHTAYTEIEVIAGDIVISATGEVSETIVGATVKLAAPFSEHVRGVRYSYAVTRDGRPVTVNSDNTFVAEEAGEYTVTITGTDSVGSTGTYIYTVNCLAETDMTKGMIERFDETWIPTEKQTYTVTTTAAEKIPSYNGQDIRVAKLPESGDEYLHFYVNPLYGEEYYRRLADEGFDGVSFWVYVKSKNNVPHKLEQKFTRGSYPMSEVPSVTKTVYPNRWTHVSLLLKNVEGPGEKDFQRSFIDSYDYIKGQLFHMFQINNSLEWGGGTGGDTITAYLSNIYATKSVDFDSFTLKDLDLADVETGDTVDFTDYIRNYTNETLALRYGDTVEYVDGEYTFTADAEYTLTVQLRDGCYRSDELATEFTVTSPVELLWDDDAFFFDTDGVCDLTRLNVRALNAGVPAVVESCRYKVSLGGVPVGHENGVFDYAQSGAYDVELTAEVRSGAQTITVIRTLTLDLSMDGETVFSDVSDSDNVYTWTYSGGRSNRYHTYEENKTVDGKTADMLVLKERQQHIYLQVMPLYSKGYYEKLAAADATLTFSYYIDTDKWDARALRLVGESGGGTEQPVKTWRTATIGLATITEYYDKLTLTETDGTNDMKLCFFWVDDPAATVYIADMRINRTPDETAVYVNPLLDGALHTDTAYDLGFGGVYIGGLRVPDEVVTYTVSSGAVIEDGMLTFTSAGTVSVTVTYTAFTLDGKAYEGGAFTFGLTADADKVDGSTPDIFD